MVLDQNWLKEHGFRSNATGLSLLDKAFRYLLGARSREDLDARLETFSGILHHAFDGNEDDIDSDPAEEYLNYLLSTRFAPRDHRAFLPGDRRAQTHALYGMFDSPEISRYNMNLESFIKTYLVTQHHRRAFRTVLPAFEYLSGLGRDGHLVPASLPQLVETLKSRDDRS